MCYPRTLRYFLFFLAYQTNSEWNKSLETEYLTLLQKVVKGAHFLHLLL